jgi:hypothetical protein
MKIKAALVLLSMLAVSGCETTGDGVLTHTSYAMTAQDRAVVHSTLQSKLKARGLVVEHLQASEHLDSRMVIVCGYVSGATASGGRTKPAVFGGTFTTTGRTSFSLFGGGGSGQDSNRTAAVRGICKANGISI